MYKVESIPTDKSKVPLRKCMVDGILPKFPFSMMISGRSGSGKTNVLLNILTKDNMYNKYFHYYCRNIIMNVCVALFVLLNCSF